MPEPSIGRTDAVRRESAAESRARDPTVTPATRQVDSMVVAGVGQPAVASSVEKKRKELRQLGVGDANRKVRCHNLPTAALAAKHRRDAHRDI
jgi:hypothetical protein